MKIGPDIDLPDHDCPWCSTPLNAASQVGGDNESAPTGGDITMCYKCANVIIFNDDLSLRKPTLEEAFAFPPDVFMIQKALQESIQEVEGGA